LLYTVGSIMDVNDQVAKTFFVAQNGAYTSMLHSGGHLCRLNNHDRSNALLWRMKAQGIGSALNPLCEREFKSGDRTDSASCTCDLLSIAH